MEQPKILYGICGIGNGHTNRQRPIVEHFSRRGAKMAILGYGNSYDYFSERFERDPNVLVQPVAVPFYVGNRDGLDFLATLEAEQNQQVDFFRTNIQALANVQQFLGQPDLAITDYEPNAADYAHATQSPLVTFDQQSKYFVGNFPQELNGTYYQDEVARLSMMFRYADARLACSFFEVPRRPDAKEEIRLYPPLLKDWIYNFERNPSKSPLSILVYLTKQKGLEQTTEEVAEICSQQRGTLFHLFSPEARTIEKRGSNVVIHPHGDPYFENALSECSGIVSTAGHTLLSEAMHLEIPVYAMPLPIYEQQMNAHVIGENGFGISHPCLTSSRLTQFVQGLPQYTSAIQNDTEVLMRGSGEADIIELLEREFLSND